MVRLVLSCLLLVACNPPPRDRPPDGAVPGDAEIDAPLPPDPITALKDMPGACSVDNWCWRRPIPAGHRLNAIHATAHDDLWLVGETGYVLQWNGKTWRQHLLPAPPFRSSMNLGIIAGRGPNNVYVAGGNILYHWDGTSWTLRDYILPAVDQQFNDVWIAPNGDVWVSMDYGVMNKSIAGGPFEETAVPPAQAPLSQLGSIWGTSPDDVWISGRPGRMFRWDGASYTEYSTGTYKSGGNLDGANADDAWIGGYDGTLVHWDGTSWTPVDTGLGATWYIKGIAVVAADDVWWLAQRGSNAGAILHWNGTSLTKTTIDTNIVMLDLGIVAGRWWIPAERGAIYSKASTYDPIVPVIEPVEESIEAMWGATDADLYLGSPGAIVHWNGNAWTRENVPDVHTLNALSGLALDEGQEVWAVGATSATADVFHLNGTWTKQQLAGPPLNGVWPLREGEAIAVGDGGTVYRHDGGTWTPIASPVTTDLFAVWAPDPDHAIIVGAAGTILRWDRSAPDVLVLESTSITADLRAVHGAAGTIWIASSDLGADSRVAVFQSSASGWIRHPVTNLLGGESVFARSATDVAVVGPNNGDALFRWNGSEFVEERIGYGGTLSAIFRAPGGSEWVTGPNALLQHVE